MTTQVNNYNRNNHIKNSKLVKKANKNLVLDAIKNFECITIEGIINHTGLTRPTVMNFLKELTQQELVIPVGLAQSDNVGRQPMLYSINPEGYFAIGIDVDAPPVRLVVSNINAESIYTSNWIIGEDDLIDKIIDDIVMHVEKAIYETQIPRERILGIGLGLPAIVDIRKNKVVKSSRIKGNVDIPIDKIIFERTQLNVVIRIDAHLLGIAEYKKQKNAENMLYIIHRVGIGMAPILNGQVYEGNMGNSGYMGHITIVPEGRQCECGNEGCLETYCSKLTIANEYTNKTNRTTSYKEVLLKAQKGDEIAIEILKTAGYYFGIGISNIIRLYDVSIVVLGDLECNENHVFFKSIRKSMVKHIESFTNTMPKLSIGKLAEKEFGLGGCYFILQDFFKSPV